MLEELEEVCGHLAALHRELGVIEQEKAKQRARALTDTEHPNITAAKENADLAVLDFTVDIIRVKGEIAAYRERKDYLLAVLDVR